MRIIEAARQEDAAMRRRVAALMAPLDPEAAADLARFTEEDEAKAREAARIAAANAAREAEERARVAAEERETAALRASFRTLPAGALYAKADELQAAGETEKAREAFRTFVARFPSSPLATNAAQQLSVLSGGPVPAQSASSPQTAAGPAAASTTGREPAAAATARPVARLSPDAIQRCDDTRQAMISASQRMGPALADRTAGYNVYQTFTESCAGHPRASEYVADAIRMLQRAGAPLPTGARASASGASPPASNGALSSAQVAECDRVIKAEQVASQSWPGDVRAVSARLGRFQYDLFNGRCAGHPQAAQYLRSARTMLAQGGVSVPSSPSAAARPSSPQTTVQSTGGLPDRGPMSPGGQSGRRTYLTLDGQPCIRSLGYQRDRVQPHSTATYGAFHFQNMCDQDIVVRARIRGEVKGVYGSSTTIFRKRGAEPGRGNLTCLYERGNRTYDCVALEEWWTD